MSQSDHKMKQKYVEKFVVKKAITESFRKSAIPNMQRLLNREDKEKKKNFKTIENTMPVNYGNMLITSLSQ